MGLKDKHHRPYEPEIAQEAKAWVVNIACTKPKDHVLAAELWTISALARLVGEHAQSAGFARLANAGKSTVWRILNENDIKPHKIVYYLEKRDPVFDRKMQEVLMVYRDVWRYTEGAVHDALDAHYPEEAIIRVVLDNHSAHNFLPVACQPLVW